MAHGDTEVTRDDVTDVTMSPPVPIISTKDGDATTKLSPNSVRGKSTLITFVSSSTCDDTGCCYFESCVLLGP
jgi:hypothetical protein